MTEIDDLARRIGVVEHLLGMEHEPPLDRLSSIDFRLDSLRGMMQQEGLAIGDLAGTVTRLETRQLEQSVDMAETTAGVRAILALLTPKDE